MPYHVVYDVELPYQDISDIGIRLVAPALPVLLRRWDRTFGNERTTETVGVMDSGSTHTVFSSELATLLGINDLENGSKISIRTAGGSIYAYMFDDVEMEITIGSIRKKFSSQIRFADRHIPRNILGLDLVFQNFQIGFHDSRQRVYLRDDSSA